MATIKTEKYVYKNCPIPGGGYVTGFIFHEKAKDVLYCRTDIGGTYRYEVKADNWKSLIDHVTTEDIAETFPISVALDHDDPDILYIASGINKKPNGKLAVSHDRGETFSYYKLPVMVHGNLNGRGTGERLIVDANDNNRLLFASQQEGLWESLDCGKNWTKLTGFPEEYMTLVAQSLDGKILVAAGAGVTTKRSEHLRGHSLYVSLDGGKNFTMLKAKESENINGEGDICNQDTEIEGVDLAGQIAHRCTFDEDFLYVTYSVMGRNAYVRENGYSCDGGSVIGGKIYRYALKDILNMVSDSLDLDIVDNNDDRENSNIQELRIGEDITPTENKNNLLEYGFSGISINGALVASTICKDDGDCIYRSYDQGNTWECILHGLDIGCMDFRTSYMKPEHNGGGNLIHWLTDLKIDPHNKNRAWFNTGTGVFRTDNLNDTVVHFTDWSDGIEETVHLNLYSPPSGEVKLIDILGDLGGFAFKKLDEPCKNSFADDDGNRYITCINADYSDTDPKTVIVTPRGNWTGKTKGGLIISKDGCESFERIELPYGISNELDTAFKLIETPNVNSGWVAISADTMNIVWSVADGIELPVSRVIVSNDGGKTFAKTEVYSVVNGEYVCKNDGKFKAFSDRVNSNLFYGFDENAKVYLSTDAGRSFKQIRVISDAESPEFPTVDFGIIDTQNKTEVRVENGKERNIYMALDKEGMWKMEIVTDCHDSTAKVTKLSRGNDAVYHLGLGIAQNTSDYLNSSKVIYIAGTVDGQYGFYRTEDEGKNYTRLNTNEQMFGDINSIEGDSREFGRFFLATGSRGVLYGQPFDM